jgi:transcriptional regulator with XRE-family HTH domain
LLAIGQPECHGGRRRIDVAEKRGARRKREDELDRKGLANVVSARMEAEHIQQAELTRRSGISVAYIRQIQYAQGTNQFSYETLSAISTVLGWHDDYLYRLFYKLPESDYISPTGADLVTQAMMAKLEPYLAKIDAMDERLSATMDAITDVNNKIAALIDSSGQHPGGS